MKAISKANKQKIWVDGSGFFIIYNRAKESRLAGVKVSRIIYYCSMLYLAFPLRSRRQPVLTSGFVPRKTSRWQVNAATNSRYHRGERYRRHSSSAAKQLTTRTTTTRTRCQGTKIHQVNPAFTCK